METNNTSHEPAAILFQSGYNCCQAVFGAYCERWGMDVQTGFRVTAGMGGGMGGLREKCGAVTGLFLLAGLKEGAYAPSDSDAKERMYELVKELDRRFTSLCSSTNCKQLLEEAECSFSNVPGLRDEKYYATRPCTALVEAASRIAQELLVE